MNENDQDNNLAETVKSQAAILGGFVALIWLIELIDLLLFGGSLDGFGIRPRTLSGLWGILLSPILHIGYQHLMTNTLPFVILGWLILARNRRDFFVVTAVTVLISGFGVWLIAPAQSVHVGASGLIFGYFGFLLLRGYFDRSFTSLAIGFFVILLYGGLVWGVLPLRAGVSWQGHLFGFVGGGLAAYLISDRDKEITIKILEQ